MFVADSAGTSVTTTAGTDGPDPRAAAREASDLIAAAKEQLEREHGLDPVQAFELLRHYCRTSDLPMRDVARKLVHGTWLPGTAT